MATPGGAAEHLPVWSVEQYPFRRFRKDILMIRRLLPAAAAFAVVVAISASVFAGGGTQIPIRMKNVGPAAVAVSAGGRTP